MKHQYSVMTHYEQHAPSSWCALMWCPTRNLARRLRAQRKRAYNVRVMGFLVVTDAEHDVARALTDSDEMLMCFSCDGSPHWQGEYDSSKAKARAMAAGR